MIGRDMASGKELGQDGRMSTATADNVKEIHRSEHLSDADRAGWDRDGFVVVRGLLRPDEVAEIRGHFDTLAAEPKPIDGHWHPATDAGAAARDPLKRYPRFLQPHGFSDVAKRYMLHERIGDVLRELMQDEPIAAQSMFYFKPTGAKGQALHQDNYYLRVSPFTCVAAWCAIDPSRPENGGMSLVPGTRDYALQCPRLGDDTPEHVRSGSFTHDYVAPPAGTEAVPCVMEPGDVLLFNGSVIHGSGPNDHESLWRRSFICHYMPSAATEIADWYHEYGLWNFAGERVERDVSQEAGGPCGTDDTQMKAGMTIAV